VTAPADLANLRPRLTAMWAELAAGLVVQVDGGMMTLLGSVDVDAAVP
jgi:hypothetical protein